MAKSGDLYFKLLDDIDNVFNSCTGDQFLSKLAERYGLTHIAYLGLNIPNTTDEAYIQTTFSDKWVRRYTSENYIKIDPVVICGLRGILPIDWKLVRNKNKKVKNFFGEAQELGVGRQGLSFPIHGVHRENAIFSINSDVNDVEWEKIQKAYMRDFQLIAYHFHNNILEKEGNAVEFLNQLTPREIESIKWAASGKTAWETGIIMGIKESTVSFYIEQARVKLHAANKTQAVAKAIRNNLIN